MTEYDLDRLNDELEKKQNRLDEIIEEIEKLEDLRDEWYITPEQFFAITYRIRELEQEKEHTEGDIEEIERLIERVERDLERAEEIENLRELNRRIEDLKDEQEEKIKEIRETLEEAEEEKDSSKISGLIGLIGTIAGFCAGGIGGIIAAVASFGGGGWGVYSGLEDAADELEKAEELQQELAAIIDETEELQGICDRLADELARISECVVCRLKYPTDEMVEFVGGGFICGECQDGECDICGVGYSTAVGGATVFKLTATSDCDKCSGNEGFYRTQPDLESLNHPNCQCDVEEMELCPKCFSEIDFTE